MLFIMTWKIRNGSHQEAVKKFLETGAPLPEGLTQKGRYHAPGSTHGWLVVEGQDAGLLYRHASEWAHLLEMVIEPVVEDEAAGTQSKVVWGQ